MCFNQPAGHFSASVSAREMLLRLKLIAHIERVVRRMFALGLSTANDVWLNIAREANIGRKVIN